MSSPSILSTAEYYKLSLIAAGVDLADIPPILDTATWRHMMLAALYQISSGGGGGGYIDGVVDTYNDLPVTVGTPALNTVYLVRFGSGVWLINRHPAGLYIRIANNGTLADWEYLGTFPEVQSDLRWRVYNETDPTKEVALDVSNVTTGTLRTLGVPNASGRIQIEGQPIGDVSSSSGAFTTLSATGTATLPHIHGALAGSLYIHVKNVSGVQLSRGTPVYVVGNVGATDRVEVAAADFDDPTKMPAVGLLKQTLANNADGDAVIVGELDNADTSLYTLNQELFVGNNGAITGTRPTSGQIQSVGTVARVQSSTGVIVVNMQGTEFAFQSPPVIGSVTPNAGTFTNLVANTELQLPSAAPASPSAGDIYRSADQIRYRDSTGTTERILLNNLDNLANLGNTATARTNIGLGSASNVTFGSIQNTPIGSTTAAAITGTTGTFSTLSANNGTIAASAPALNIEQTWNGAGVNFIAAQINAIRASGSSSSADAELLRLSENGTEVFRFRRTGQIVASSLQLTATSGNISIGSNAFWFGGAGSAPSLTSGSSTALDLRNQANAMDFRIYGQYTSASNFERLSLKYNSTATAFQIGTEKGSGGGLARPLEFQTDGVTRMTIAATGSFGTVTINGVLANRALATNTWAAVDSLNSSGQQVGGFGYGGTGVSNFPDQMYFASAGKDLVLAIAANGTNNPIIVNGSTGLLSFYGKTNAFPALKRSSTTLQVRLADDSAFAPLSCGALTLNGNLDASTRDIVTDTTTGTKIGTATTQKIGFFDKTPVVRPSAVADATDAASVITQLNALLSRMRDLGLIAT